MVAESGLRERKKQRTRRALIEAAARLFEEQGYETTTVAEIAAAVEVSPRTVFSYFPGKEDILFADTEARVRIAVDTIAAREPGEPVAEVLLRAFQEVMTSEAFAADLGARAAAVRLALIMSVPALQAAAMRRVLHAQQQIADALHRAYPRELDPGAAAAVVGALVGAAVGAVTTSLREGHDLARTRAEFGRAVEVAMRGIAAPVPPLPGGPFPDPPARQRRRA